MMDVLALQDLSKVFKVNGRFHHAVKGFSCKVNAGEVVAIVGESGSGKSTIARMIVGLEEPSQGSVMLMTNAESRRPNLKDVQMVFQDPFASLNPVHTVQTHLHRSLRRLRNDLVGPEATSNELKRLLNLVELKPCETYLERYPTSMSGGQRQRVAIARALAPKPSFVVADEPTSMLDVSIRGEILDLFLTLKKQGLGIILITHDLMSVKAIADRVYVLKEGVCVEEGYTDAILNHPSHPYTQQLCASVPDPDGAFMQDKRESKNINAVDIPTQRVRESQSNEV